MKPFVLPRGATGFNIDDPPDQRLERRQQFVAWCRALADTQSSVAEPLDMVGNFDLVSIEKQGLWFLQNRFVPLMGVLDGPPKPGFAFAVDSTFVDLAPLPSHLALWGPTVLPASILNRELLSADWVEFSVPALAHADRFKPTRVRHVLFNYWD